MSDYSPESGRQADIDHLLERIQSKHERISDDVDFLRTQQRQTLDWDNAKHRRMVKEKFKDYSDQEAMLAGFGPDGHGKNARGDCGDPHPFICDSCGHSVSFGRTCGMSVCARCGVTWVRDTAINKAAKIRRVRKEKHHSTPDREHQKIHHVILSPCLDWYFDLAREGVSFDAARELTREIVKEILDELRAQGLLVRHSFRGANDDGSCKDEGDDRGQWKQRLNSGREWFGDVRDELAWNPHYHAVVVSDWIQGEELSERLQDATGWIVHRIADDDGVSLESDGAMARAATYTLSHADIIVNPDGHNRSAVWEVGSFEADPIKSTSRFSARPSDLDWADSVVRRFSGQILGLSSGTTDCGATLPAVDDPDELARRVLEELYPNEDSHDVDTDDVLYNISQNNISVDVSSTSGGGGNVTVRDAFGEPVTDGFAVGSSAFEMRGSATVDAADEPPSTMLVANNDQDDCGCGHDHGEQVDDRECDGRLIPLGEARKRGLLDDPDWIADAPHVDEARQADREWPDDLPSWIFSSPDNVRAIGTG